MFGSWAGSEIRSPKSEARGVLDVGAGTGLLSLMLAQKNPDLNIAAIEIDKDAVEQAKENIAASPWADRINLIHADARGYFFPQQYDVIISNPPFYENELKADDKKKNIAHHSDDLPLAEVLKIIRTNLATNGSFYLLLPYKRNEEIKKLLTENDLDVTSLVLVRQSLHHDYFRIMLAGKIKINGNTETILEEIAITDANRQYTPAFSNLLTDFYLHL